MNILLAALALALLLIVLRDAYETIILPRRVRRRFQVTGIFYRTSWRIWRWVALRLQGPFSEQALGWFGPFSLLMLLAVWATSIVIAFGVMQWAAGIGADQTGEARGLLHAIYFSGTTFFTLGLGDVAPQTGIGKLLTVIETGLGFAFLAIVVGYLPVIYQAFSRREIIISLLDARAGSPPSAGELLRRHGPDPGHERLNHQLVDWERWAAEVLETHLSYPVLAYFRSQHSNQSWLAALTIILDTTAVASLGAAGGCRRQAELTFGMARHAVVDLAQVFSASRPAKVPDRLSGSDFATMLGWAKDAGLDLAPSLENRLAALRGLYEPYLTALSRHLVLPLPPWIRGAPRLDNWETAPWKSVSPSPHTAEHFMERQG